MAAFTVQKWNLEKSQTAIEAALLIPRDVDVSPDEITKARWRTITFITGTAASQVERIVGILLDKKLKTADEKLLQLEPFLGKSLGDSSLQKIADFLGVKAKQTIAQTSWYKDRKTVADIGEESDGADRCNAAKKKAKTVTFKNKDGEGDFAGRETRIRTVKGKPN